MVKKLYSNDIHLFYSVVLSLNYLKFIKKIISDATTHVEQRNKLFMIMARVGLSPKFDSTYKIILGSIIISYDTVNEQMLHLTTPYDFG